MVQIDAESARFDDSGQAPVGGRDYADVKLGRMSAAHFDLLNSLLAMVAMVSLVYALMEVARPGAGLLGATFAGVIGMTVIVILVRRQNRSSTPMIDFSLFGNGRLQPAY
jgi:hypothetical protein